MMNKQHSLIFMVLQLIIIILFATVTEYDLKSLPQAGITHYKMFQDVNVMIFIGFGFLMTFLKHHSWSAVGFNFLITAWVIQVSILFLGMWEGIFCSHDCHSKIYIDITTLIRGDFAAGAVMITFGALLGKVTGFQLVILAIWEMCFYALNETIGVESLKAIDMGGSMYVHTFGAFFGIGASMSFSKRDSSKSKNNGDSYNSNLFAMIGTIFLFMFWPSFNGALATGDQEHRVILNTTFALVGSCVSTFITSSMVNKGKFKMEDILNATLAGGVIIGTSSDLCRNPFLPTIIGFFGGAISTLMYSYISPKLQAKNIVHDTCGVLNLHGIPGVLGGLIGGINAGVAKNDSFGDVPLEEVIPNRADYSPVQTAVIQMAMTFITVGIALSSGYLGGLIIKWKKFEYVEDIDDMYQDTLFWEMEGEEEEENISVKAKQTKKIKTSKVQPVQFKVYQNKDSDQQIQKVNQQQQQVPLDSCERDYQDVKLQIQTEQSEDNSQKSKSGKNIKINNVFDQSEDQNSDNLQIIDIENIKKVK